MTYVVNESCIRCKYMDCVEVCPVDCFYEGENMLVIHPDECIDCGVCEPECPVDATPSPEWKNGSRLMLNMLGSGQISPRSTSRRQMQRTGRVNLTRPACYRQTLAQVIETGAREASCADFGVGVWGFNPKPE